MAIKANFEPAHVGGFIKDMIIPDGMTVTAAARLLGVGRPALSELLNENASLSPEMALRIEKGLRRHDGQILRNGTSRSIALAMTSALRLTKRSLNGNAAK